MGPLEEQTVLITGSTDGLGRHVAGELAGRGAQVIVHGRDPQRVERTVREIGGASGYVTDLSSLAQVRRLADEVRKSEQRLDVLVNNAGVYVPERSESEDGHELGFAVNYLAGFALSLLLLPLLEASAPARIVNVASVGQWPIDFDDVMLERDYEGFRSYAQSKLAQVLFTFELAERLGEDSGVTVNALHPATLMDTKMVRQSLGRSQDSVEEGAASVIRLVADPELDGVTGRYFDRTRESRANDQAYDPDARRRLWGLSEELSGPALRGAPAAR
jgi:NAD(P)-dependent dehydrogenase (short-subunit alcohol dehydrogenase family)